MEPTAAAPTSGRTDLPRDGAYCTFRPLGTSEGMGKVNWRSEDKDSGLGRPTRMTDLVMNDGLNAWGGWSVNRVREMACRLGWAKADGAGR